MRVMTAIDANATRRANAAPPRLMSVSAVKDLRKMRVKRRRERSGKTKLGLSGCYSGWQENLCCTPAKHACVRDISARDLRPLGRERYLMRKRMRQRTLQRWPRPLFLVILSTDHGNSNPKSGPTPERTRKLRGDYELQK